jgi:ABC-2 type transport system permease protein
MRSGRTIILKFLLNSTAYRANLLITAALQALQVVVQVFLWAAVYGGGQIQGYTLRQFLSYFVTVNLVYALTDSQGMAFEVGGEIRSGALSASLVRPIGLFRYQFYRQLGSRLFAAAMTIGPFFLVLVALSLFPGLGLRTGLGVQVSVPGFLAASLFVVLSFVFNFWLNLLVSASAFWIENAWIPIFVKYQVLALLCGTVFPYDLFPLSFQRALTALPFKYLGFYPFQVLRDGFDSVEFVRGIILVSVWTAVAAAGCALVWRRGMRRYTAVGG